jgi:nicotinamidase-related amidase
MTERPWDDLLSERDRQVIEAAGYDARGASNWNTRGVGERPMVLVVDMQRLIVAEDVSIFEAIEETSRIAIGEGAWRAMAEMVDLVERARELGHPITYTRVVPSAYDDPGHPDLAVVDALAPAPEDDVLDKRYASCFHGTDLVSRLVRAGVDTLVVVGGTTSGCLRATVVDAQQSGFNVVVPQECVFDRLDLSHRVSLLDMWMKYADVRETTEVLAMLESVARKS